MVLLSKVFPENEAIIPSQRGGQLMTHFLHTSTLNLLRVPKNARRDGFLAWNAFCQSRLSLFLLPFACVHSIGQDNYNDCLDLHDNYPSGIWMTVLIQRPAPPNTPLCYMYEVQIPDPQYFPLRFHLLIWRLWRNTSIHIRFLVLISTYERGGGAAAGGL